MALKNIEDYIIEDLGIPNVNLEGLDISVAYEIADALTYAFIAFPALTFSICSIGNDKYIEEQANMVLNANILKRPKYEKIENQGQIMTTCTMEGAIFKGHKMFIGLALHEDLYDIKIEKLNRLALESAENGYHPKSCTNFRSCIYHEIGHILSRILNLKNDIILKMLIYTQINNLADIDKKVSKYARTSFEELIAEIIACYLTNSNENRLINTVGKYIEEKYKKYEYSRKFQINNAYKISSKEDNQTLNLVYKKEN